MSKAPMQSIVSHGLWALLSAVLVANAHAQSVTVGSGDDALARSIVEKADQIRFPAEPFQVDVDIVTTRQGERSEARKYRVLSKGNDNTIVTLTEPASERGQSMLMKGRDLWVFMPNVSQPVRLSLAQRLTGQVANGDLARANFAGDYTPKILRTETIAGEAHYVIELNAVDRGVTYQRVVYLGPPIERVAVSGRVLFTVEPTAEDVQVRALPESGRPDETYASVMDDALRQSEQSVVEYHDMTVRDLPDRMFSKGYLRRLE